MPVPPDLALDPALQGRYHLAMTELMRTNDPTQIAFAEALLKAEGIECFVMDVHMSILEGSIGILPRRVLVAQEHAFRARAILRDNALPLSVPR